MTLSEPPAPSSELVPTAAKDAWLRLADLIDEIGAVACRTSDAEAWFPEPTEMDEFGARMAIAACAACPVRKPCLEYALAADERFGIWGATTPEQRRQVKRRRSAA